MKVILLDDVKPLGKKGETVTINDGYARNYILPKRLGIEATNKNLNELKLQKANEERLAKAKLDEAKALAAKIEEQEIVLTVKVGESGKIFGSISSKEIAEAAKQQIALDIDKKKLQLPSPIKTVGTHTIPFKIHPKVTASLKVIVKEA